MFVSDLSEFHSLRIIKIDRFHLTKSSDKIIKIEIEPDFVSKCSRGKKKITTQSFRGE